MYNTIKLYIPWFSLLIYFLPCSLTTNTPGEFITPSCHKLSPCLYPCIHGLST